MSTSLIGSDYPLKKEYTCPEIIGTIAIHIFSITPKQPKAVALYQYLFIPNICSGTVDYNVGIKTLE